MTTANFGGLCVLALESRREKEIAKLIANLGGIPDGSPLGSGSCAGIK